MVADFKGRVLDIRRLELVISDAMINIKDYT